MRNLVSIAAIFLIVSTFVPAGLAAQSDTDELRREVEQLRRQLEALEAKLDAMEAEPEGEEITELQEDTDIEDEADVHGELAEKIAAEPKGLASYMDVYGSLRVLTGVDSAGVSEIDDNVSRIGLQGELPFGEDRYAAFAKFEVGVRLVSTPQQLSFAGDPGFGIGQEGDTITSRLGLAGVRTPFGQFSWGKQESTYYDIAGWTTDQSWVFGGEASSAYHNGTDGGLSGTGRADEASQYRLEVGPVHLGLQVQNRNTPDNPNSKNWGDTLGGSLRYVADNGFSAGVAYQEVRDGEEEPDVGFPAIGDKATILGLRYDADRFYLGGVWSITEQHESDDLGNFYDGNGLELYGRYLLTDDVRVEGGWVTSRPDSGQVGEYKINYGYAGVGYLFGTEKRGAVWFEFRLDGSRANDGSDLRNSLFAGGVTFDF